MASLSDLLQPGAASVGLLLTSALVLGALHGLEPGHSKTMLTAFIIAVRGTVAQAVLLGLAATVSHTAVVWVVALLGLHFASRYDAAFAEPYFQVASAGLIPCSAAIAVLALCLQINQLWLGIALVACFSIGLAVTLVAAGIVAALGMRHASRRWLGLGDLARRAPYLSGIVMIGVGLYVGWEGWTNASIAL